MKSFWTRRRFFGAAAKTSAVVVTSSWALGCSRDIPPGAPIAGVRSSERLALQRFSYLLFPFPEIGSEPYERVAAAVAAAVDADPETAALVSGGLATLNAVADRPWLELDEASQVAGLQSIEGEPFFAYMLGTTKAQLFNDRTVWAHIGFDPNAPLNDIDWLGDD